MSRVRLVSLVVVGSSLSCSSPPRLDTRTFELQYLEGHRAAVMIDPYVYGDRERAPGTLSHAGNTITVRETPDNLEKIARVLAEQDRATPRVNLSFQVIEADGAATTDPAIAEVEEQLRRLFRFAGYRLLAEAFVGGTEGSTIVQRLNGVDGPYRITVEIARVRARGDSGTVTIGVGLTTEDGSVLETQVNARAGQTVVLGNAQLKRSGGTLILTVRPQLVEM